MSTYRSKCGAARITRDDEPFCKSLPWKIVIRGTVRAYRGSFYASVVYARAYGFTILEGQQ